jgi:hypothetical protein
MKKQPEKILQISTIKIFIFIVILLTLNILGAYWFYFKSNTNIKVEEFIRPYPLIDVARSFVDQKHYITTIQPLREKLREMSLEYGKDDVSIYVEFLNTGANISINQDTYIWPASLTKVPIAIVALKKIQDGEWNLDSELVLMPEDIDAGSGDEMSMLAGEIVGTRFTVDYLLEALLADSDNTAYRVLYRNISSNELLHFIESIGLDQLATEDGKVSAKEYSRIFRSLYTASYLNREYSQRMLEYLNSSTFNFFLRKSVPENIIFPHKYGEHTIVNAYSDSGIVYVPDRPYIISVMVKGDIEVDSDKEERKAADFMQRVSLEAYNYFSNYSND